MMLIYSFIPDDAVTDMEETEEEDVLEHGQWADLDSDTDIRDGHDDIEQDDEQTA